jgi:hypothetical protein
MSVGQDPQEPSPNADSARQIHFGTGRLRRECWVTYAVVPDVGPVGTRHSRRRFFAKLGGDLSLHLIPVIAPNGFLKQTFAVW